MTPVDWSKLVTCTKVFEGLQESIINPVKWVAPDTSREAERLSLKLIAKVEDG
jgi:hypothetical protein